MKLKLWKVEMSYLSRQFVKICDQCPESFVFDTSIDEILNESEQYMAPKRYRRVVAATTTVNDDSSESEEIGRGSSSETSHRIECDGNDDVDEEFLNDEDVRNLESELRLDLTSKLKRKTDFGYDDVQKESIANDSESCSTEESTEGRVESPAPPSPPPPPPMGIERLAEQGTDSIDLGADGEEDEDASTFILDCWFLQFTSKSKVFVEGDLVVMNDSNLARERKNSSSIVERIDSRTLRTKSGNIYKLKGPIDASTASECGVPQILVEQFKNGFPRLWKDLIAKHFMIRKDVSRKITRKSPRTHDTEKPRIDVDSLPRTRSGRLIFPPLEFWRQERLLTLPDVSLLISVDTSNGKHVHNSTILNETFRKPTTTVTKPKKKNLIEPVVVLSRCNQQHSLKKETTKKNISKEVEINEEEEVDDDGSDYEEVVITRSRKDVKKDTLKNGKVVEKTRKIVSKQVEIDEEEEEDDDDSDYEEVAITRSRKDLKKDTSKNGKVVESLISEKTKTMSSVSLEPPPWFVLRNRTVPVNSRADEPIDQKGTKSANQVIGKPGLASSSKPIRESAKAPRSRRRKLVVSTEMDTIPEKRTKAQKTIACKRPLQKRKPKRTSFSSNQSDSSNSKEDGGMPKNPPSEEETTKVARKTTDYKKPARPGTLLFKEQMREYLLRNSQDDDDDDFTNSTPYRNKKRFKISGMRLDEFDDDEEPEIDVETPCFRVPFLNPASTKKTPASYKSMVTPHSRPVAVDRKRIDRYIRNRKINSKRKEKPSKPNCGTPHYRSKTQPKQIDSSCFGSLVSIPTSVQDDDDEDEQDYYFSDEDN